MKKLNWLFVAMFSFAFMSCDKDDDVELDTTAPMINISSPSANAMYAPGDDVMLNAEVTDNIGLEEIMVFVTDPSGTERLIDDEEVRDFANDNREADLEMTIGLDETAPIGEYMITIEAVDEQGNKTEETVDFMVEM